MESLMSHLFRKCWAKHDEIWPLYSRTCQSLNLVKALPLNKYFPMKPVPWEAHPVDSSTCNGIPLLVPRASTVLSATTQMSTDIAEGRVLPSLCYRRGRAPPEVK